MTTKDQVKLAKLNRASRAWVELRSALREIESFHSSIGSDKESCLSHSHKILESTASLLGARMVEGDYWVVIE